ncbi:MAG: PG0541 family transporter-associated protein [Syntrophales bacterium]|jgi:hypothetical protein|nr:hypothetical protein [Syntrophales bacterium]NLN59756.1 hypothetical protein [Deltaproteobacteria bacterium]
MKMFYVIYPDYFDELMTKAIKRAGYKQYTKMHGLTGEGEESEAKLGTSYSPGRNKTLLMAVDDNEIPRLLEMMRELRAEHPKAGFRAFTFPLEECV